MKNRFPLVIKSLAAAASVLTLLFTAVYHMYRQPWMLSAAISCGTTGYHFLMRLMVGYLLPKVTDYGFDYRHPWFQPRSWEPALYRRLKLKSWKGNLPTYSPEQFSLNHNSLHRVIQNMCGAEIVHEVIMVFSFLPLTFAIPFGDFPVFLITSVIAALYDSIFVMAQRYNRPRLVRIYEKQCGYTAAPVPQMPRRDGKPVPCDFSFEVSDHE